MSANVILQCGSINLHVIGNCQRARARRKAIVNDPETFLPRQYLLNSLKDVPTVVFNSRHEVDSVQVADGLSNRRTKCVWVWVCLGFGVEFTPKTQNVGFTIELVDDEIVAFNS